MEFWQDKAVLITGGSAGFGLVLGQTFARAGARVALAARNSDQLAEVTKSLTDEGGRVIGVPTDVTRPADVQAMIAQTVEEFGQLDVLVNNAGRSSRGEAAATPAAEFRELLELNFLALVECTQQALPHLKQSRGHVVNIGSLSAKTASRFMGAYPASKFPVAAFSQQLRLELVADGIHVLLVCPGPIARTDAGQRYTQQANGLPAEAQKPGGGAKLKGIPPELLAKKILTTCQHRKPELVMPAKARLLFAIAQLSPRLGDWILTKMT